MRDQIGKRNITAAGTRIAKQQNPTKNMAEDAILAFLEKNDEISDSGKFADEHGFAHDEIVNVIRSLNGFRLVDAQVLSFSAFHMHFLLLSISIFDDVCLIISLFSGHLLQQ